MNRAKFVNKALNRNGRPIYDMVYHNFRLDPSEVAKSKRYDLWFDNEPTNITYDAEDIKIEIEKDWSYGFKTFVCTFGIIQSVNNDGTKRRVQFAGYWK